MTYVKLLEDEYWESPERYPKLELKAGTILKLDEVTHKVPSSMGALMGVFTHPNKPGQSLFILLEGWPDDDEEDKPKIRMLSPLELLAEEGEIINDG